MTAMGPVSLLLGYARLWVRSGKLPRGSLGFPWGINHSNDISPLKMKTKWVRDVARSRTKRRDMLHDDPWTLR